MITEQAFSGDNHCDYGPDSTSFEGTKGLVLIFE